MSDKLKEKELLEWLDEAHGSDLLSDALDKEHPRTGQTPEYWSEKARIREQAYQQIRERVQAYAEHQELEACYIDIVIDLYDQLEQKKPKVDEEFVEKWTKKLEADLLPYSVVIDIDKKKVKQMLKEAGAEVVEKR